ncbi:MAG: hypothetical protein JXA73_05870 [Acidobacteria bacterium]|nr:hypothetical protein [Acidobacteriota bacterium]
MKKGICFLLLNLLVISWPLMAQTGPAGVWQGDLDAGAGQKLNLQIAINKLAGGAYGVTVHYMEQGTVKNLTATSVSFENGKLAFTVKDLGGSYSGTLENKTITGNWRQSGKAVSMVLTPFKRSKPAGRDMDRLLGEWASINTTREGFPLRTVYRFRKADNGSLIGFLDYPDAGVINTQIVDILLQNDQLRFGVPLISVQYSGRFTDKGIEAQVAYPDGTTGKVFLIKDKKYDPPVIRLGLSPKVRETLKGRWTANLGTATIIFRFEQNSGGEFAGFFDIPESNVKGMQIYKASLVDGALLLKSLGMNFSGTLSGNTISGTMTGALDHSSVPLAVTKE